MCGGCPPEVSPRADVGGRAARCGETAGGRSGDGGLPEWGEGLCYQWGQERWAGLGVDASRLFFALAVGHGMFWVVDSLVVRDSNDGMGLLYGFELLEIV
jgi:hypothetical protein